MKKVFFIFSIFSALILYHGCESYRDSPEGAQRQEEQLPTETPQVQNFPEKGGPAGNR